MVLLQRKYTFPRIQRGSNIFQGGGGQLLPGRVQMLISIETHITCDFPGGVRTPYPPLNPHMNCSMTCYFQLMWHFDKSSIGLDEPQCSLLQGF